MTFLYYDLAKPKRKYIGSLQSKSKFFNFGSMWAGRRARDKQHVGELVSNNWNGKANKPILSKE